MTIGDRVQALRDLIDVRTPVADAVQRLRKFPWDSDVELVELGPGDLARLLDLYLQGKIERSEVEAWAEAIEGRDDIGYHSQNSETIKEAIFELANPMLTRPLEPIRARKWREALGHIAL